MIIAIAIVVAAIRITTANVPIIAIVTNAALFVVVFIPIVRKIILGVGMVIAVVIGTIHVTVIVML